MVSTITIAAILAVSAGLLFIVPMTVEAAGEWKDLSNATKTNNGNSLKLTITANGTITRDASMFDDTGNKVVLGYAWLEGTMTNGKVNAFVAAIHPLFTDSTNKPDKWHSHNLKLRFITGPLFCLAESDIGTTHAGIAIKENTIKVSTPLSKSGIDFANLKIATSFTIWDPDHPRTLRTCDDGELLVRANSIGRNTEIRL